MKDKDRGTVLQAASVNVAAALHDASYITEKEKIWLVDRINRGDKSAYDDLRELLLKLAAELEQK